MYFSITGKGSGSGALNKTEKFAELYQHMNSLKFILLTTLSLFIAFQLQAQFANTDTLEMPANKNAIGVNITAPFVLLTNGTLASPRYSLQYKRQIEVNRKLRFSVNLNERERSQQSGLDGNIVTFSDSTVTIENRTARATDYDLRGGMEWFSPRAKTTTVFGFDAIAGFANEQEKLMQSQYLRQDSSSTLINSPYRDPVETTKEIAFIYLGLDFSVGQRFDISDVFNILIQWTPEITYRMPIEEKYSDPQNRYRPARDSFLFNLRGIEIYFHMLF